MLHAPQNLESVSRRISRGGTGNATPRGADGILRAIFGSPAARPTSRDMRATTHTHDMKPTSVRRVTTYEAQTIILTFSPLSRTQCTDRRPDQGTHRPVADIPDRGTRTAAQLMTQTRSTPTPFSTLTRRGQGRKVVHGDRAHTVDVCCGRERTAFLALTREPHQEDHHGKHYHHTLTQPSATGYQRCRHASSRVTSRVPQPQLNMGQSRLCGANAPFTSAHGCGM